MSKFSPARYIMIGGFLGAGKTASIARLAEHLRAKGLRIGLITNDQGSNLVDTAMLRSKGFATEEIPGGCFCCRFNSLVEAAHKLSADFAPDIFIAEPVGSCTDIAATVAYPLRRIYGENFTVAPVSVVLDPARALRIFGVEAGGSFSEKVVYIYKKQVEEADIVVINKSDLIPPVRLAALQAAISREFPGKEILTVSARTGTGLEEWFHRMEVETQDSHQAMNVNYDIYAEGEALLGWFNGTVQIEATQPVNPNLFLKRFASAIQSGLESSGVEIAHLKMTLSPDRSLSGAIAAISLVRNDYLPELSFALDAPITSGQLIVNLRAEGDPYLLAQTVREQLEMTLPDYPSLVARIDHIEYFRPGKPSPTHRIAELTA